MSFLNDERLSWKAKGLYACIVKAQGFFCHSLYEASVDMDAILAGSKSGRWEMRAAIAELRHFGFLLKSENIEFVYLIHSKWSGFYKIGYTKGETVDDRLRGMRTGDPSIYLVSKIRAGRNHETLLHAAFAEKRIEGEWFRLSADDAEFIKSRMEEATRGGF